MFENGRSYFWIFENASGVVSAHTARLMFAENPEIAFSTLL